METGQTRDCCEKDPGGSSEGRSPPAKCGKHKDDTSIANDGGDGEDCQPRGLWQPSRLELIGARQCPCCKKARTPVYLAADYRFELHVVACEKKRKKVRCRGCGKEVHSSKLNLTLVASTTRPPLTYTFKADELQALLDN
jgi:hypothetical protein